jgi:hypothetical protein
MYVAFHSEKLITGYDDDDDDDYDDNTDSTSRFSDTFRLLYSYLPDVILIYVKCKSNFININSYFI